LDAPPQLGGSPAPPFRAVSAVVSARLCDRCPVRALGGGDGQCPAPWPTDWSGRCVDCRNRLTAEHSIGDAQPCP
jgi:hypothetical protein